MEAFSTYLLKSVLWLTGFALVYFLFLRNERFFALKRVYLVAGILVSFLFPLISFTYQVEVPVPEIDQEALMQSGSTTVQQIATEKLFNFRIILLIVYLSGVFLLLYRNIRQAGSIFRTINKEIPEFRGPVTVVRATSFPVSFSFFNYIFINPSINPEETKEIMNHELVHVKQKHWLDLLLAEILRLVQWVNPFVWIYTGFIRMNHEYLADEAALQQTENPANYRTALLNQLFKAPVVSLSNSFNYSLNKKRFDMMKKIVTSPYRKMKVLFVLPVFAIIFYAFATPEFKYITQVKNSLPENVVSVTTEEIVKGVVLDEENKPIAGVNIVVTGTYSGVSTDAAGRFAISNIPENEALVISKAGYKTQFIKADYSGEMTVKLMKDPEYRRQVQLRTFEFGSTDAKPLIIVDGVISDKGVDGIDPSVIESVTVLKDKSATVTYGEKGKDGVILITTKKKISGTNVTSDTESEPEPFVVVEEMPMFPGGDVALLQYIADHTQYPEAAREKNIQGRVIARFCVTSTGAVNQISVLKGVDPELDAEAVRVVSSFPEFKPGKQGGKPVPVWYMVPITFTIPSETQEAKIEQPTTSGEEPFTAVEQMPQYPGGDVALLRFIAENTSYPAEAKTGNIQGRVIVRFVVTSEGKMADATVIKGVHQLLDAEALRVVNLLGDGWQPGMQGGKPVAVWYMIPVTFTLK